MSGLVLALSVIARDFGVFAGQQQTDVFDRTRLADPWSTIDERTHDAVAQTTYNQFIE